MDPADLAAEVQLYYSYETCGNLNMYTDVRHYEYLRGRHIRVSYPGDSGSGYTLKTLPDGTKTGSVVIDRSTGALYMGGGSAARSQPQPLLLILYGVRASSGSE
eukprot:COSAG02_NODE_2529_length_8602_cov_20.688463_3_plen_104_part_00